jgi:uncharacterized MnhB-related membrane protein
MKVDKEGFLRTRSIESIMFRNLLNCVVAASIKSRFIVALDTTQPP